jgi:prolipoprotein diacylglyceryltransferase
MEFVFSLLILTVCFFLLYILCRQDFVLLRQNISLSQILDTAILTVLFAFTAGRLFFLINNQDFALLHAIRFFHFIKFPGISIIGFALGGFLALWFFMRRKKGILRTFDIFSVSFFPLYSFSLIIKSYTQGGAFALPIILLILSIILFAFFIRSHFRYILRDGSISLIFLLIISADSFLYEYLNPERHIVLLDFTAAQVLSIIVAAASAVFLFLNQKAKA